MYTTHLPILLPNLSMLSTQDLGAKVTSILRRDGPGISLSPNLDSLIVSQVYVFNE